MLKKQMKGVLAGLMAVTALVGAAQAQDVDYVVPEGMEQAIQKAHKEFYQKQAQSPVANKTSAVVTIDVLFMYDAPAEDQLGMAGLYQYVNESLEIANQHFADSSIDVVVRSAGLIEAPYTYHLQNAGSMSGVYAQTYNYYPQGETYPIGVKPDVEAGEYDQYGADAYALLTGWEPSDGSNTCGYAGIGTYVPELGPAYQVLQADLAGDDCEQRVFFTHELGHNLGGGHADGPAGFSYARPYACGGASTVMSATAFRDNPGFFSNLIVEVDGALCGEADVADMKRAIDEAAPILASIKEPVARDLLTLTSDVTTISEESEGSVTFTLTRDGDFSSEAQLSYQITMGASGVNSISANELSGDLEGVVIFAVGESSKSVSVTMVDDAIVEDDEGFTFSVASNSMTGLQLAEGQTGQIEVVVTSGDEEQTQEPEPEEPTNSSGGGSTSWLLLLMLAGAGLFRRK